MDSGNFDWSRYPDKFPGLTTPDDSYHGVVYTEKFGRAAYITKATVQLMRDLGAIQSPDNAYIISLGLESLELRMRRHSDNALKVATHLQGCDKIAWVRYPALPGDKYYSLAEKYLKNGASGVISFGIKGGRSAAESFMKKLRLASIETHVADSKTCCLHPASSTHRQMTDEELEKAGVGADLIRFSCGIEDADDIIADIDNALAE